MMAAGAEHGPTDCRQNCQVSNAIDEIGALQLQAQIGQEGADHLDALSQTRRL